MGKTFVKEHNASPIYKFLIEQSGKAVIWNYGKVSTDLSKISA